MQNNLLTFDPPAQTVTMSSYQMAELTQTRHDSVKRTIESLAARALVTLPQTVEVSNPGKGPKTVEIYEMTERDSYVVVARLSPEFTAALVDYWQATKKPAPVALPDFNNPAIAARAWAEQFEQREAAEALADKRKEVIDSQREHVEFSLAVDTPENALDLGEFASLLARKEFKIGRQRLVDLFIEEGYLTRTGRELRPTAYAKERDWIVLVYPTPSGDFPVRAQAFVTVKGQKYFIDKYITKPAKEAARIAARVAAAEPKRIEDSRAQKQKGGLFDKAKRPA